MKKYNGFSLIWKDWLGVCDNSFINGRPRKSGGGFDPPSRLLSSWLSLYHYRRANRQLPVYAGDGLVVE